MKSKKLCLALLIINFALCILFLLLMVFFFVLPSILGISCNEQVGCMNESGIYVIVGLINLPIFILFLSTTIFLSIIYYKKHSKYSNKKHIGKFVHVVMDRKLGSTHPKHKDMIYPINYGYVPNLIGGDGEEQDVYVLGVDTPIDTFDGKVIAVIYRYNDNETKWVACKDDENYTVEQIKELTDFQEKYYKIKIITK